MFKICGAVIVALSKTVMEAKFVMPFDDMSTFCTAGKVAQSLESPEGGG
jgi:hypothetical protein